MCAVWPSRRADTLRPGLDYSITAGQGTGVKVFYLTLILSPIVLASTAPKVTTVQLIKYTGRQTSSCSGFSNGAEMEGCYRPPPSRLNMQFS